MGMAPEQRRQHNPDAAADVDHVAARGPVPQQGGGDAQVRRQRGHQTIECVAIGLVVGQTRPHPFTEDLVVGRTAGSDRVLQHEHGLAQVHVAGSPMHPSRIVGAQDVADVAETDRLGAGRLEQPDRREVPAQPAKSVLVHVEPDRKFGVVDRPRGQGVGQPDGCGRTERAGNVDPEHGHELLGVRRALGFEVGRARRLRRATLRRGHVPTSRAMTGARSSMSSIWPTMIELMPSSLRSRWNFSVNESTVPMKRCGDSSTSSGLIGTPLRSVSLAATSSAAGRTSSVTIGAVKVG